MAYCFLKKLKWLGALQKVDYDIFFLRHQASQTYKAHLKPLVPFTSLLSKMLTECHQ